MWHPRQFWYIIDGIEASILFATADISISTRTCPKSAASVTNNTVHINTWTLALFNELTNEIRWEIVVPCTLPEQRRETFRTLIHTNTHSDVHSDRQSVRRRARAHTRRTSEQPWRKQERFGVICSLQADWRWLSWYCCIGQTRRAATLPRSMRRKPIRTVSARWVIPSGNNVMEQQVIFLYITIAGWFYQRLQLRCRHGGSFQQHEDLPASTEFAGEELLSILQGEPETRVSLLARRQSLRHTLLSGGKLWRAVHTGGHQGEGRAEG